MGRRVTSSAAETEAAGKELGEGLKPGQIVCLFGELGAGKTTFIKGLVAGATGKAPEEVSSPTYVYLHPYEGTCVVYHFDLYRLPSGDAFYLAGFDEYFDAGGICCIEWAGRLEDQLPEHYIAVTLKATEQNKREITVEER